jgi:hypothetical protein
MSSDLTKPAAIFAQRGLSYRAHPFPPYCARMHRISIRESSLNAAPNVAVAPSASQRALKISAAFMKARGVVERSACVDFSASTMPRASLNQPTRFFNPPWGTRERASNTRQTMPARL